MCDVIKAYTKMILHLLGWHKNKVGVYGKAEEMQLWKVYKYKHLELVKDQE